MRFTCVDKKLIEKKSPDVTTHRLYLSHHNEHLKRDQVTMLEVSKEAYDSVEPDKVYEIFFKKVSDTPEAVSLTHEQHKHEKGPTEPFLDEPLGSKVKKNKGKKASEEIKPEKEAIEKS